MGMMDWVSGKSKQSLVKLGPRTQELMLLLLYYEINAKVNKHVYSASYVPVAHGTHLLLVTT